MESPIFENQIIAYQELFKDRKDMVKRRNSGKRYEVFLLPMYRVDHIEVWTYPCKRGILPETFRYKLGSINR
jgi:hypothetical protein